MAVDSVEKKPGISFEIEIVAVSSQLINNGRGCWFLIFKVLTVYQQLLYNSYR